jgi:hypothetical protein
VGLAGCLLSATRPTGALLLLPVLGFIWEDYKSHGKLHRSYLWIALMPCGLLAFMLYEWHHVGDPLAFKHIQAAWYRTGWHLHNFSTQFWQAYANRVFSFWFMLVGLAFALQLYLERFKKEALFLILIIAPAVAGGVFDSLARYVSTVFPFYLALVVISYKKPSLQIVLLILEASFLPVYIFSWMEHLSYLV